MAKQKRKKTKAGVPGEAGVKDDLATGGANGGHNGPTDEDRQVLFHQHFKTYVKAKTEVDAATARFRNACKLARAECGQDAVKRFRRAVELSTPEGEQRVRDELGMIVEVAKWVGSPVGTQFSFELEPDRTPAVDRAREDGKRAGLAGEQRKPPHAPGTAQEQAWLEGHGIGQEKLGKKGFKEQAPPAAAVT